jgi:CHAD domain-containing protein
MDELGRSPHVSSAAVEKVRAVVAEERAARRAVMLKRLSRVKSEKLARRLASVGAALETATGEPWRKALGARLLKRSRRLNDAMDAAGHMYAPDRLHAVRIAAKKLRYGLELASDSGLKPAAPLVRTLKRVQDMLGKLHDLQVLQTHIADVQIAQNSSRADSRAALEDLARYVEDQCRHLHGRYVSLAPGIRDATVTIRKTIVPQLAHARTRKAPLKMSLPGRAGGQRAAGGR